MKESPVNKENIVSLVRLWVESFVVQLNLCPFAKRELLNDTVRFISSDATTEERLLDDLKKELDRLNSDSLVETTLLIHPYVLQNFYDYNDFLDCVDELIKGLDLEGIYQVASFHPDYQFFGTNVEDAENYTNRSPYPILHILREESLERVTASYSDVDKIPVRNISVMNDMGNEKLQEVFSSYFN